MSADTALMQAESKPNRRPLGKAKLLRFDQIDRRTSAGKHAAQLRDKLIAERGGPESMGTMRALIANDVAAVSAMIEDALARWLSGEEVDAASLATLMNVRRRDAELIGIDPEPRDVTVGLHDAGGLLDQIAADDPVHDECGSVPVEQNPSTMVTSHE